MTNRPRETAVDPLFLDRWSPRAFDGRALPESDIRALFDAARHAPSAYNYQPARFLYAVPGTADWARFLALLVPFNQDWVKTAGLLAFILSEETMGAPDKPNHSHSFDAGAAWMSLALQAHIMGYEAHGMTGVDFDRARAELGVPAGWRVEAAFAVGRIGPVDRLPEHLHAAESQRTARKPIDEVAYPGNFRA